MSNKTQLQASNEKYASLIEVLKTKGTPSGGEDVAAEVSTYTEKIASLESAVTALETELAGKASGGSGGDIKTAQVTVLATNGVTFTYAGANGINTIYNDSQLVEIVVPSICVAIGDSGNYISYSSGAGAELIFSNGAICVISVVADGTISVNCYSGGN